MASFFLRFPLNQITKWEKAYTFPGGDEEPMRIGALAKEQGCLTRDQFLTIARWKSPRPAKHHQANDEQTVEEVTRFAFQGVPEPLRLRTLTLLSGVRPRTASAILHLCHPDPYPMMDVRAFWSLGVDKEPSDWEAVWPEYVQVCRDLAAQARVSMRTLDRALWGFSARAKQFAGRLATG